MASRFADALFVKIDVDELAVPTYPTRGQGLHGQPRRMVLASDEWKLFGIGTEEEEERHGRRRTEHLSSSTFFSIPSLLVCACAAAHPWSCLSCRCHWTQGWSLCLLAEASRSTPVYGAADVVKMAFYTMLLMLHVNGGE
ncbi:hypothetical protein CFC21_036637 [Triticum aestivum]|uniref:Uncharacterized protein n=3 Tax=Triticum TaxID=4564 RepID=A0A9R0RV84_TRITD|nr:hypothetical protein CFC21_036637 [Triticum aestivum]VAH65131.1 unnamed protein product [Triticum turgidum subsp. durum]